MEINNFYNFKNSIRHFFNIDNMDFPFEIDEIKIENLTWTEPINFRVRKENNKYRTLKMPNILNFICAYECFKDYEHFLDTSKIDKRKRLVPNLDTGDFATGIYDVYLENDFQKLCIYDNLLKLDIKSYYERIYTHHIEFKEQEDERYLSNLNLGNTNGLIMGNYISLYFAEKYSKEISDEIQNRLEKAQIDCSFSYFSDDFYFFCNRKDNQKIINLFNIALERYNLERNDGKVEIWTYLEYNEYHLIEKYWKKIIYECKSRYNQKNNDNKLHFTNQLIYRMSNLKDYKSKKIFLTNFFKSTYFQELDMKKYSIQEFNCHQLCYIFKFSPEVMIYSINKFKHFPYFTGEIFKKFLEVRYKDVLCKSYNEEQLYYYYAIKILGFDSILEETENIVVDCNNQLLISYYLKDNIFKYENIEKLKLKKNERYWFQNYHLILFIDLEDNLENNIKKYLIPECIIMNPKNKNNIRIKQETYIKFYENNLKLGISIIRDIEDIKNIVTNYMDLKIEERIEVFGESD
ncbi:hypothetical protein J1C67_01920 [Clostridium gasigenes]|uniref:hypothetical protein n=1 Tax=Clostridium gasigenes TaxID=94869 RepID=UPI00143865F5|nr:hypothetical protein [Clostridium gasigenes]NKF08730.1 hypothetical protein [Clostridium gasigenes]QSW19983.1 hypothetical protein J1C67_01920 [Clostridium gasigenes]